MKKRIFTVFLFAGLLLSLSLSLSASAESDSRVFLSNYIQTAYNSSNGFPADEANAVIQTADGYMWFATYNGLIQYDGEKFITYTAIKDGGFNSSNVRALYEGNDGALWIGTNDKGLVRHEKGVFTYYDKDIGAPSNIVRAVAGNKEGVIYCGTADGIFAVDTSGGDPESYTVSVLPLETDAALFVISISCDGNGNVFAVLNNGELYAVTSGGKTVKMNTGRLFYSVSCTSGGRVAAGSQDTVAVFADFDGNNFTSVKEFETGLKNINTVYEDSAGRIWVGAGTGLGFFEDDYGNGFNRLEDIEYGGYFTGIFEDYENGYWFTSSAGGVVKLTYSVFTDENILYGIPPATTNAILKHSGLTYVATDSGLILINNASDENGSIVENEITELLSGARIRDIYLDSKGFIWFCTYSGQGIIRYNPENGATDTILPSEGLNSERTRRILELQNGCYAAATSNGVNFIKDLKIVSAEDALRGEYIRLPETMALCFYEAEDGTLYIGTDGNGLYAVKDGKVRKYDEESGLSGSVILRVVGDSQRNGIWVSTSVGLCFIDNNTLDARYIEKLPAYSVFDMLIDGGEMWMLTSNALLKTNAAELLDDSIPITIEEIGRSSGLTSSINANSRKYIDEDKRLYICCDKGINSISVEKTVSEKIPNAAVNKVEADGNTFKNYDNEIVIPKNTERLTFDISLLSYGFNSGTTLHYMLEGQDKQEIIIDTAGGVPGEVSYTNLAGGQYTFILYPADRNGNTGTRITVSIMKEYGIFELLYIKIIIGICVVIIVVLFGLQIIKHKTKASLKKQNEYRDIVTQSISAIANAIDAKDPYTKGHSVRVASYSAEIARRMGYDNSFIENIYYIGLLHDVGKIGIPLSILNKPDKLTAEEYEIIKTHPKVGKEILKDITTIRNLTLGAAEHHERWDGGGYNQGLRGIEISIEGRIISAADSYDAMSSDRAYRKALPQNVIYSEFTRGSGSQFDPSIAEIVTEMINQDSFKAVDINEIIDFEK